MKVELTEQQARAVVETARLGNRAIAAGQAKRLNPGDEAAAFKAIEILDEAWRKSVGT